MRTILDRPQQPLHYLWAAVGAIVVGYVFLAALGAFEPEEVIELTVVVVAMAALLLAHEWREQFRDER
jgi:cyanate permease